MYINSQAGFSSQQRAMTERTSKFAIHISKLCVKMGGSAIPFIAEIKTSKGLYVKVNVCSLLAFIHE